jgi:hypothetical protein
VFRASRLDSIFVDSGDPPLPMRSRVCPLQLRCEVGKANQAPDTAAVFVPPPAKGTKFTSYPGPVDVRLQDLLQRSGTKLPHIIPIRFPKFAACHIIHPTCDLRLTRCAATHTYRLYSPELLSAYPDHSAVYSYGSFIQGSTGSAFTYNGQA